MVLKVPHFLGPHDLSVLIDFLLFGATLACVAIFHRHTLAVALIGLGAITLKKLLGTGFNEGAGFPVSSPISPMNGCSWRICFCFWSALLCLHAISRRAEFLNGCLPLYRTIGPVVSCF